MSRTLTRQQSRAIDRLASKQMGMPGMVLMENAGRGIADVLRQVDGPLFPDLARTPTCSLGKVSIFCGKGNNAGDGFVLARHLALGGIQVQVLLLLSPHQLRGDARQNYDILASMEVPIEDLSDSHERVPEWERLAGDSDWLVDALLGTGAQGTPREPLDQAIEWMNGRPGNRLAVDLPSGLDCDTGEPENPTFKANITCTMVAPKVGFQSAAAKPFLGQVHVVSIGIPLSWLDLLAS